jgi:transglutaminase-like putative cysteine protease
MLLQVRHLTHYAYEEPARAAALRLKLYPSRFNTQRVREWSVSVNGEAVEPALTNAFGDRESIWTANEPLQALEIIAEGIVEIEDAAGVVRGLNEAARPGVFLRSSDLTEADPAIEALAESVRATAALDALHQLSDRVSDAVQYLTDSTTAATSAAEALRLGRGVCQDHAHVFISAARVLGYPTRYVAGYRCQDSETLHDTHAWAEAHLPDLGWVGFDPSNRQSPTDAYIRLCAGFDALDAAPVRGSVSMGGDEALAVEVEVAQQ